MLPLILAVAGGYLIGDATKDKVKFDDGGVFGTSDDIEIGAESQEKRVTADGRVRATLLDLARSQRAEYENILYVPANEGSFDGVEKAKKIGAISIEEINEIKQNYISEALEYRKTNKSLISVIDEYVNFDKYYNFIYGSKEIRSGSDFSNAQLLNKDWVYLYKYVTSRGSALDFKSAKHIAEVISSKGMECIIAPTFVVNSNNLIKNPNNEMSAELINRIYYVIFVRHSQLGMIFKALGYKNEYGEYSSQKADGGTMADGGIFNFGGKSRYNKGRAWTLDHYQHNKNEDYEKPIKKRKTIVRN